jgi:hypothetical protein
MPNGGTSVLNHGQNVARNKSVQYAMRLKRAGLGVSFVIDDSSIKNGTVPS